MIKIILAITLTLGVLQAENVVHYDKKGKKKAQITKPNYPTSDLYTKK